MNNISYFIIGYLIIGTILGRISYYVGHKKYENSEEKLKHNWDWDTYENHNDINVLSALLTFFWIIVVIVYIIVRSYEIFKKK